MKNNVADYIFSHENLVYTPWERIFAWLPKTTINNERVWLRFIYKRERMLIHDIPQLPVKALNKIQYATAMDIAERTLRGLV